MIDENINQTLKELTEILHPNALVRLNSHINSLIRDIGDLRTSRNNWKKKYQELKDEIQKED